MQLLLPIGSKEDRLEREIDKLREQCEKVRKGQYAKLGALTKLYLETRQELDFLKEAICKSEMLCKELTK